MCYMPSLLDGTSDCATWDSAGHLPSESDQPIWRSPNTYLKPVASQHTPTHRPMPPPSPCYPFLPNKTLAHMIMSLRGSARSLLVSPPYYIPSHRSMSPLSPRHPFSSPLTRKCNLGKGYGTQNALLVCSDQTIWKSARCFKPLTLHTVPHAAELAPITLSLHTHSEM